jgi:hypothetical protein
MGKIASKLAGDAKNPFAVDIWQKGVYNRRIKVVLPGKRVAPGVMKK